MLKAYNVASTLYTETEEAGAVYLKRVSVALSLLTFIDTHEMDPYSSLVNVRCQTVLLV